LQDIIISFPLFGLVLNPPRYFSIFGFNIHLYGLILATGLVVAAIWAMRQAPRFGLTQDNVLDMLIFAVPASIVFSRLYFVVFNWEMYSDNPITIITGIRSGGLTIYGVIFGAFLGAWICSRVRKIDFLSFIDLGGMGLLIGQAIGRWGNFINRELYGLPTDLPWRMGLTTEGIGTIYVHPTFLYESLWNLLGLLLIFTYSKRVGRKYKGQLFLFYLAWYGLGRIWVEALRDPTQNMFLGAIPINMAIAVLCAVGATVANVIILSRQKTKGEKA